MIIPATAAHEYKVVRRVYCWHLPARPVESRPVRWIYTDPNDAIENWERQATIAKIDRWWKAFEQKLPDLLSFFARKSDWDVNAWIERSPTVTASRQLPYPRGMLMMNQRLRRFAAKLREGHGNLRFPSVASHRALHSWAALAAPCVLASGALFPSDGPPRETI